MINKTQEFQYNELLNSLIAESDAQLKESANKQFYKTNYPKAIVLGFSLILLASFSGMAKPKDTQSLPDLTDKQVYDAAYNFPKYPKDFIIHEKDDPLVKYAGSWHIKEMGHTSNHWIELSAENIEKAELLVVKYEQNSAYPYQIKSSRSNDRYFEFLIDYNGKLPEKKLRIHNSNYITDIEYYWTADSGCNFFHDLNSLKVNFIPITKQEITKLLDYLWLNQFKSNDGSKMLYRIVKEDKKSVTYDYLSIEIIYGDWNLPDRIYLIHTSIIVYKDSGNTKITHYLLKTVDGKMNIINR